MRVLLDTHLLLWAAGSPQRLSTARTRWPFMGCRRCTRNPFDRILLAQAQTESLTLLTADKELAKYGPPCKLV